VPWWGAVYHAWDLARAEVPTLIDGWVALLP
jgi:hypothetical protein